MSNDAPAELFVPARTGTHGDVLAAVGLAQLVASAVSGPVMIHGRSGGFAIEPLAAPGDVFCNTAPTAPGYQYMRPNEKSAFPVEVPEGPDHRLDYPGEAAEEKRKWEGRQALQKEVEKQRKAGGLSPELQEQLARLQPRRDWRRWQALNLLQGDETANRVYLKIRSLLPEEFRAALRAGLGSLAGSAEPPKWGASPVQLFTPTWAKGYSRYKPDSTDRNKNVNERWVNSFEEWLKYRGYFSAACPYISPTKDKHVRLICPVPQEISVAALRAVCDRLLEAPIFGSDPKIDILSVLTLATILVEHSPFAREAAAEEEPSDPLAGVLPPGRTPAQVISGVTFTHYQSLGQARAVAALGTLALPGWFPIASSEDVRAWRDLLAEHRAVIRGLRDDHSDEIGLLVMYRRFLQQSGEDAVQAFLDFAAAYGQFLIRAREQRHVRSFQTDHLERIVSMSSSLSEILANPGFRAVAAAIRRATVSAQVQKARKVPHTREIRYDLLPDLRRKRALPGRAFVEAVAEFVASYNAENGRRLERGLKTPPRVTTEEFEAFLQLFDQPSDTSAVGALLCAYATCKVPWEEPEAATQEATDDPETNFNEGADE